MSNPKRIVRNPITGEELHYFKGPKQANQVPNYDTDHNVRVKELLKDSVPNTPRQIIPKPAKTESNLSVMANASSIPLLNFTDLLSSEDRKITDKNERDKEIEKVTNQVKLTDFKNQNPIVAPIAVEQSARPKSSYRHGFKQNEALASPILQYQNQLVKKEPSPLVSKLEAPRTKSVLNDLEEISSLQKPATEKKQSIYKIERVADLERLWLESGGMTPANRMESKQIKSENDDKTKSLKEKLVIDTVITDQLSRFALSDPTNQRIFSENPQVKTVYTARGNRFTINDNHTRPTSSLSENTLAKRCKFNCRIKTANGKIALRELFGILFLHDGSLTIYEFRLLFGAYFTGMGSGNVSKKASALPFISRRVYTHMFGRRKGNPIEIWDIFKGAILYLPSNMNDQSSVPDSIKQSADYIEVEVTDVDELEKENLLSASIFKNNKLSSDDMNRNIREIKERLQNPYSDEELRDIRIVNSVKIFMKKQIEARSVEVYMGISTILKNMSGKNDQEFGYAGHGLINQQDFYDALLEYSVQIHSEDLDIVWQVLDSDSIGYISYYRVIRAYFGEMNILRHNYFRSLIHKIDTQKTGYVKVIDIHKYYKASRHPKVRSGEMTEGAMFQQFLSSFTLLTPSQVQDYNESSLMADANSSLISYEQLEEYYNGLSIVIDSDEDFVEIMKNSWNLV